jgi:hypothetical protein
MVISDLNIKYFTVIPSKTNSVLVVNTNTPLTFSVTGEPLQAVAWWYPEVFQ